MPITRFLQSLSGTCRHCGQPAGVFQNRHPQCRQTLQAIAQRSRATDEDIDRALEEGFRQGVAQAMADGIITRDEEERLRAFRDVTQGIIPKRQRVNGAVPFNLMKSEQLV